MDDADFYLYDLKTKFDKIKPNEYYLSYSGGKDSHLLYWFIKEYAKIDGIDIISVNTYMEHHSILKRMKNNSDVILLGSMNPNEIKEKYGIPCFSKMQDEFIERYQRGSRASSTMKAVNCDYGRMGLNKKASKLLLSGDLHSISNKCCFLLKKKPLKEYELNTGKKAIIGVKATDSLLRGSKYKSCFTKNGNFTPLHDLTNELEQIIYEKYNIEIPSVYEHIDRTGCMGCPYGSYKHNCEKELSLLNKPQREFVINLFKESYDVLGVNYKQFEND